MNQIYAHITGLDDDGKNVLVEFIDKTSKFVLQDLDDFTNKIIEDSNMIYLFEKYEYYKEKLCNPNITKLQNKQFQVKIKVLERKMNVYWKNKMDEFIENLLVNTNRYIIFIGYSTYYKNHKIGVKIKSNLKFFQKLDINSHVKSLIKYNLDKYRDDIINGTFPIEYLTHRDLIKKREQLIINYTKSGYKLETINNIINYLHIGFENPIPDILFFASKTNYTKKLPLKNNKLICYDKEWIAMISCLDNNITKGYNGIKPFISIKNLDDIDRSIYLYVITDTNTFLPIFSKGLIYKYETNISIQFEQKIDIDSIYDKLKFLKIKINITK